MAPLLKVLVQLLPGLPSTSRWSTYPETPAFPPGLNQAKQHQQSMFPCDGPTRAPAIRSLRDQIAAVSRGENRLDVFHLVENNLTHKYWDGHQWNPPKLELETLGNGLATPPVAVTWGDDRLDVFGLDDHDVIKHQYWDGSAWLPHTAEFENLGGACNSQYAIAAATWGKHRLDVFCVGPDGDLLHQYYDGSQWQPSAGSLESLGGSLAGDLSVVSWGTNRLDIFSVNEQGHIVHLYWDGHQWSEWETFDDAPVDIESSGVTASSWGKDRLDIFGTAVGGKLWHIYWDGTKWSRWEQLDDDFIINFGAGRATVTSWAPNRLDVVMSSGFDQTYRYKYYDGIGQSWRPTIEEWYTKGPKAGTEDFFSSNPTAVSWGENRLDIFGVAGDQLLHQAWTGSDWYPGNTEWEILAGPPVVSASTRGKQELASQAIFEEAELRR